MEHGRITGVDCDSDSMDSFAPSVNPGTCTKYAEDPQIVALYLPSSSGTTMTASAAWSVRS